MTETLMNQRDLRQELRERLLTDFCVEGVIALPEGAFAPYTGLRTNLIVIHRNTPAPTVRFFQVEDFPPSRREMDMLIPVLYKAALNTASSSGSQQFKTLQ